MFDASVHYVKQRTGSFTNLVPDADVSSFGQKQLHLVHMLVLCRPDHGCPASVILR